MTPYRMGLLVSQKPNNNIEECPFQYNSEECNEWWRGYGEGTLLLILEKCTLCNEKYKPIES